MNSGRLVSIAALLMVTWVSIPAPAYASMDVFQCDAGACGDGTLRVPADCGPEGLGVCTLADADRIGCGVSVDSDPGRVVNPPVGPPPVVGPPVAVPRDPLPDIPQPPISLPPILPELVIGNANVQTCTQFHLGCVGAVGSGCWLGTLVPTRAVADAAPPLIDVKHQLPGDHIDTYSAQLGAGRYRFAMAQPPSLGDYTLCVYPPGQGVSQAPVPNRLPQSASEIIGAVDVNGGDVRLNMGALETIEITSLVPGTWYISVVAGTCPSSVSHASTPSPVDPLRGPIDQVEDRIEAIIDSFAIKTTKACYPYCTMVHSTSYCFGLVKVGEA